MRQEPNIVITGTPGVGKSIHCELLSRNTGMKHVSINRIAEDNNCFDGYDEELQSKIVDEEKVLDALEDEAKEGGLIFDWHACDFFPESWIDLVVVLRCSNKQLYDRLKARNYSERKLQENIDAEIMEVILSEARESFDENIVIELASNEADDVTNNVDRIERWRIDWQEKDATGDEEQS